MIDAIDHVNIRTPDVPATSRFFADVLDMAVIPSPGTPDLNLAAWICDTQGRAVVHLASDRIAYPWEDAAAPPPASDLGTGRVHHVAMRCSGYDRMRDRLEAQGRPFHANELPGAGLRQLFVSDPNAVLLELNFFGD